MKRIDLTEGGHGHEVELTPAQVGELRASEFVKVAKGSRPSFWRITSSRYVGAIRIGSGADGVEVRIEPKLRIDRLIFLIGYAQKQHRWHQQEIQVREAAGLLPVVAHAFARAADRALRPGVLLGYHEIEASIPAVVGRIREADQLRRWYDFPLPVEVRYDDFTPDIDENRLLLAAADRLLQLTDIYDETRKLLRHLLSRLDGIGRLSPGRPLPRWQPTPLNRRYQMALGLADLVLRGASYELDGTPGEDSTLRADGLMVLNMWKVFENFVTTGLTNALGPYGGGCTPQDRRHHLDDARLCQLIPDLVYEQPGPGGVPVPAAVIDAKYKIEIGPSGQNPDLFQMLAYCTVLGLDRGHLVYAEGPAEPLRHIVHGTGIEILQHSLDLSLPPDELLAQVAALAADIAGAWSAA